MKKESKKKTSRVSIGKAFREIIWPRRNLVFIGLVLIVIRSLAGLVLPIQSKVLLDEVVPSGNESGLYMLIIIVIGAITIQAITSCLLYTSPSPRDA